MTETIPPGGPARSPRREAAEEFVETIQALHNTDTGRRAALRRNAGRSLSEARNVAWFYGIAIGYGQGRLGSHFLVATLMSDNRAKPAGGRPFIGDLGRSLRELSRIRTRDAGEDAGVDAGIERRLTVLLGAKLDRRDGSGSLAHHLRQIVWRLLAQDIPIDWTQLTLDIDAWNSPERYVQRKWAMSFYGATGAEIDASPVARAGASQGPAQDTEAARDDHALADDTGDS